MIDVIDKERISDLFDWINSLLLNHQEVENDEFIFRIDGITIRSTYKKVYDSIIDNLYTMRTFIWNKVIK